MTVLHRKPLQVITLACSFVLASTVVLAAADQPDGTCPDIVAPDWALYSATWPETMCNQVGYPPVVRTVCNTYTFGKYHNDTGLLADRNCSLGEWV